MNKSQLEEYLEAFEDDEMRKIARATLETNNESPRGMVLIKAALLEERLEDLIKAVLNETKSTENLLRGGYAPLRTFNAKIDISHSLGIISEDEYVNLNAIRKIRNDFAHELFPSFEDSKMRDRVFSLDHGMASFQDKSVGAQFWFQMVCSSLIMNLHARCKLLKDKKS